MHLRPLISALGIITLLLAGAMLPCALIDLADRNGAAHVFLFSSAITALTGGLLWVLARGGDMRLGQREGFLFTVSAWIVLCAIASVPFLISGFSLTDSVFESVSGMTTTGATIIPNIVEQPRGLLLWRSITQWIGGVGIIVMAVALLPELRVGGMQLFSMESSDRTGKFLPNMSAVAASIGLAYLLLTMLCAMLYAIAGMGWFDAVNHAMTTLSAGGFSTYDASFGQFNGTAAIYIAIVFMTAASMPFSLFALLLFRGQVMAFLRDPQPRLFVIISLVFATLMFAIHRVQGDATDATLEPDFTSALFNAVSVVSGTGYANAPYDLWGPAILPLIILASLLGGCGGSAASGLKMFRLEIMAKAIWAWSKRVTQPHRKISVRYAGKVVEDETLQSVMVFVSVFMAVWLAACVMLAYAGLDTMSAISAAAACIANVGPGLGTLVGPSTNYSPINDLASWVCVVVMFFGRLELIVIFVILTRRFWRG